MKTEVQYPSATLAGGLLSRRIPRCVIVRYTETVYSILSVRYSYVSHQYITYCAFDRYKILKLSASRSNETRESSIRIEISIITVQHDKPPVSAQNYMFFHRPSVLVIIIYIVDSNPTSLTDRQCSN